MHVGAFLCWSNSITFLQLLNTDSYIDTSVLSDLSYRDSKIINFKVRATYNLSIEIRYIRWPTNNYVRICFSMIKNTFCVFVIRKSPSSAIARSCQFYKNLLFWFIQLVKKVMTLKIIQWSFEITSNHTLISFFLYNGFGKG